MVMWVDRPVTVVMRADRPVGTEAERQTVSMCVCLCMCVCVSVYLCQSVCVVECYVASQHWLT